MARTRDRMLGWVWVVIALAAGGCHSAPVGAEEGLSPIPPPRLGVASGGPRDQYTYVWGRGILESVRMYLPSEVMVFALVRETPTKDVVRGIAVRAGVQVTEEEYAAMPETGEAGGWGQDWYGSSFESRNVEDQRLFDCKDVEVWDNGSFIYRHRGGVPEPGNPLWEKDALSEEETREIAERFVGESSLLPEGCEFTEVRADCTVNAEGRRIFGEDGAAPRVLSREVVYSLRFEGIDLGHFRVRVNGEGEVYEVDCRVPRVEPLRRYPILGPEEARRMLRPGVIPSHYLGPATAEITSVSLQYSQGQDASGLLEPLYVFQGMAFGESGGTELFAVRIPAVRPEYFTHEPVIPQSGHSF